MSFLKHVFALLLVFVIIVGGAWSFVVLTENEKIVTKEGFFIKDTPRPFVIVEYRLDRIRNVEQISKYVVFGRSWSLVYSGECGRVLVFHDIKKRKTVSSSSCSEENVIFSDGIVFKVIPRDYEIVSGMLADAKRLHDKERVRYAKYF